MRRKHLFRTALLLVTLCAAGAAGIAATGSVFLSHWHPLRESGSAPESLPAAPLVSDAPSVPAPAPEPEPQWNGDFTNFLICGIDNTNSLTDVIMVVGFDNKTKKLNILQIPRDTYAGKEIPTHKYNAVYGQHAKGVSGMETLRAHVESDFGIQIGNYAAITTKGLRRLVDAAGGVDLDVPINMNYDDKRQNLHIHLKKGPQHLDGAQAEQFVRYRKGWSEGDLGRLDAQKLFLAAFAGKLRGMGIWGLTTKVMPIVSAPDFVTDLSAGDMINLGNSARKVDLGAATIFTMPGEPFESGGSDLYSVHKKELLKILNAHFVPQGVQLELGDLMIAQKADKVKDSGTGDNFEKLLS